MIELLLRTSLQRRWFVLGLATLLMGVGLWRAAGLPVDVFPDLSAPRVTVVTEASGLAPEEIERLVTFPVETAVNGVAGVRRVRSASAPGISIVWVEFDWDTQPALARQRVNERLQGLNSLPPEAEPPLLAPPSSVMGEVAFLALRSEDGDELALRRVAEVELRRRIMAIPGISQVVALGGQERQYQVLADPARLAARDLRFADLADALRTGTRNAPGGYVVEQGQESLVRVLGRARDVAALEKIVVATRGGVAVRVGDVATVQLGAAPMRGRGSYNGQPAVILSVVKQPGADTMEITRRLDEALDALEPGLAARGYQLHRDLFRQADFISTAVSNLMHVLRDGALLVILVLFLFLWSIRPTVISVVALPLSLLLAVLALDWLGYGLDTMTLGGLAIAIGELVDDAIVDVENVLRRLRERARRPEGERAPVLRVVLDASLEIRSSITSATAVLMLVFLPLLFLEGLEGRLLRPLAVAYLVAIASSLLVAVTVTPVLCSYLLPAAAGKGGGAEPPLLRRLSRSYAPWLERALRRPGRVIAGGVAIVLLGLLALAPLGRSFLPEFNEGSLTIGAVTRPGTSLEQSDQLGRLAEQALLADPAVTSTGRRTGRAERDEHVQGVEASEIEVALREDPRSKEQLLADLRERLAVVPGMQFTLGQPISHRIDHMISGQRSAFSVKVFGEDLAAARRAAEQVATILREVEGFVDVSVEPIVEIPQLVVQVDADAASLYGLSAGEAASAASLALWGEPVAQLLEEGVATDVVVRLPGHVRDSPEAVAATTIPTRGGAAVPLGAFADIRRDQGPNYIMREDVARRVVVTANIAGRDLRGAYRDAAARVADEVELAGGLHIEFAGQFEREAAAGRRLAWLGLLAIVGIALVVASTLQSARRAAIVLTNLPLAMAGGVVGVYLGGGILSVASMIGFITLFGIATRNGILLATRVRDLELEGAAREDAVRRGATERLAPILMTAVTAGLGLLPLGLALGEPGSEIQAPMALVILTGLVSSTVLNMVVVPALLLRWGGSPTAS